MTSFDVEFPVTGSVRFRLLEASAQSLTLSEAYFHVLAERMLAQYENPGEVFDLYDKGEGPWDVEGSAWTFHVSHRFLDQLRYLAQMGFELDLSKVRGAHGTKPVPSQDVLMALIGFLERAYSKRLQVEVISLP